MKRIFLISIIVALTFTLGAITLMGAEFTDWSPPVNLGPVINSEHIDSCVAISKNGLSLFFSSNRQNPSNNMDRDLYVSQRGSINDPWGVPVQLPTINSSHWDSCPALSLDEHHLYFTSNRPGGCGNQDIWVSRRQDRRDNFGWEPPVNIGCWPNGVNSPGSELTPTFFEDETGRVVMFFSGNWGSSGWDFVQSVMGDDNTFGPGALVIELNSPYTDQGITVRRDGLEVIFLSNRPGGDGNPNSLNFWRATRVSTADPWSTPVLVPSLGNPAWAQGRIALSFDGRELYFTSFRPGGYGGADLYVATREKLPSE